MDVDKLRAILTALQGTDVTRLTWVSGQETLDVRLGHPPVAPAVAAPMAVPLAAAPQPPPAAAPAAPVAAAAAAPPAKAAEDSKTLHGQLAVRGHVLSVSPRPTAPPFVDVGQVVKKGQVLCIVEAMKLMNEIEAEQPGRLIEVLVQNGSPVEYGEPLFRLEPV